MAQASQAPGVVFAPGTEKSVGQELGGLFQQLGQSLPLIFNTEGLKQQQLIDSLKSDPELLHAVAGQVRSTDPATVAQLLGLEATPEALQFFEGVEQSSPMTEAEIQSAASIEKGVPQARVMQEAETISAVRFLTPYLTDSQRAQAMKDTEFTDSARAIYAGMSTEERTNYQFKELMDQRLRQTGLDIQEASRIDARVLGEARLNVQLMIAEMQAASELLAAEAGAAGGGIKQSDLVSLERSTRDQIQSTRDNFLKDKRIERHTASQTKLTEWYSEATRRFNTAQQNFAEGRISANDYLNELRLINARVPQIELDSKGKAILRVPDDGEAEASAEATVMLGSEVEGMATGDGDIAGLNTEVSAGVTVGDSLPPEMVIDTTTRRIALEAGVPVSAVEQMVQTPEGRDTLMSRTPESQQDTVAQALAALDRAAGVQSERLSTRYGGSVMGQQFAEVANSYFQPYSSRWANQRRAERRTGTPQAAVTGQTGLPAGTNAPLPPVDFTGALTGHAAGAGPGFAGGQPAAGWTPGTPSTAGQYVNPNPIQFPERGGYPDSVYTVSPTPAMLLEALTTPVQR